VGGIWTPECRSHAERRQTTFPRDVFQHELKDANVDFKEVSVKEFRPDADVDISAEEADKFNVPSCKKCGGILKPDIVFFGDNVPRQRVEGTYDYLAKSDRLLVLGSSLQVYSAYRFLLASKEQNKPVAIVNIGPTRADHLALLTINACCGDILPKIKFS